MMWLNGADWYWGAAMMVVFWGLMALIAYLVFRWAAAQGERPTARDILDSRLANGELSDEEYERKRAALEGHHRVGGG